MRNPGDILRISVEHEGKVLEERIVLRPIIERFRGCGLFVALVVSTWFLMPWLSIGLGFWVAALRPRDARAWLVLGILVGMSQMYRPGNLDPAGWPWGIAFATMAFGSLGVLAWASCMMLFGLYFPRRWRVDEKLPWLKWMLIVPLGIVTARECLVDAIALTDYAAAQIPFRIPYQATFALISVCIGLFFAGLWGRHRDPKLGSDDRRRLGLMYWGCNVALSPLFLLIVYTLARYGRWPDDREGVFILVTFALVFLFPVTMSYVLIVQRAMDVRIVLRQGIQYALARGGIQIIQGLIIAGVVWLAASMGGSTVSRPQRIMLVALGVLIVLRIRHAGELLRRWLDRCFFREAYNAEQVLGELSEQVRSILDRDSLLDTVARKISESLHVERIAVLLFERGAFRPALATGYPAPIEIAIPPEAPAVERLRSTRAPMPAPREELAALDAEFLLPLAGRKELLGFISLGPKKSEEPYSPNDAHLLRTVAMQTGLALENSRLSEAMAAEVAERELLNREIEIAREVQQRLFPQNLPEVASVEYAGYCRPARGVGGDYYDFLALASGRLGLAIGDVSGKGVPAALLMASLQASVRGQSQAGLGNVAELITNVNWLVCDATPENRYATFFYGQLDSANRKLVYTNGGHNNPLVLRGSEVLHLEEGGPPVGLFRFSRYTQGEIQLQPGDLLILYTDGVSEAENPAEEEWGEPAMIQAARACDDLPPAEMITRIMEAADRFASGAPQHDDMTLVVLRVLPS